MLKKIALLVVMFALPLGAMAQAKFAHMNSQEVITVMPEFTKAQNDIQTLEKQLTAELLVRSVSVKPSWQDTKLM